MNASISPGLTFGFHKDKSIARTHVVNNIDIHDYKIGGIPGWRFDFNDPGNYGPEGIPDMVEGSAILEAPTNAKQGDHFTLFWGAGAAHGCETSRFRGGGRGWRDFAHARPQR